MFSPASAVEADLLHSCILPVEPGELLHVEPCPQGSNERVALFCRRRQLRLLREVRAGAGRRRARLAVERDHPRLLENVLAAGEEAEAAALGAQRRGRIARWQGELELEGKRRRQRRRLGEHAYELLLYMYMSYMSYIRRVTNVQRTVDLFFGYPQRKLLVKSMGREATTLTAYT